MAQAILPVLPVLITIAYFIFYAQPVARSLINSRSALTLSVLSCLFFSQAFYWIKLGTIASLFLSLPQVMLLVTAPFLILALLIPLFRFITTAYIFTALLVFHLLMFVPALFYQYAVFSTGDVLKALSGGILTFIFGAAVMANAPAVFKSLRESYFVMLVAITVLVIYIAFAFNIPAWSAITNALQGSPYALLYKLFLPVIRAAAPETAIETTNALVAQPSARHAIGAMIAVALSVYLFGAKLDSRGRFRLIAVVIALGLCAVLLSRQTLAVFALAFAFTFFREMFVRPGLALVGAITAVVVLFFAAIFGGYVFEFLFAEEYTGSYQGRLSAFGFALQQISANPLLGGGVEPGFPPPHNLLLSQWVNAGLFGALATLSLHVYLAAQYVWLLFQRNIDPTIIFAWGLLFFVVIMRSYAAALVISYPEWIAIGLFVGSIIAYRQGQLDVAGAGSQRARAARSSLPSRTAAPARP